MFCQLSGTYLIWLSEKSSNQGNFLMHLGPEAWLWGLCICKSQELVLQKGNLRYERIVSGRGIYEVYEFFAQREPKKVLKEASSPSEL